MTDQTNEDSYLSNSTQQETVISQAKGKSLMKKIRNPRLLSNAAFSFIFAYLLSFLFEGQVLYGAIDAHNVRAHEYIFIAILTHFAGLFTGGFIVKSHHRAKIFSIVICFFCIPVTLPFLFSPSVLWLLGLIILGYLTGLTVSSWAFYLKTLTPKNERMKSCASILIYSNLLMIGINVVTVNVSYTMGLCLSMLCLVISGGLFLLLHVGPDHALVKEEEYKSVTNLKRPLLVLCLFVVVITINSGLMYQVINPAFEHLTTLVSWYWAIPYIFALAFMKRFPLRNKIQRSLFLYIGMGMNMAAFISFMLLGRNTADYLVVDTLILGACGIFDLFWWSILGEMLSYTNNPAKVFGIGLSANVLGVLLGDVLGVIFTSTGLSDEKVTVLALIVVWVTLVILPPLNKQLLLLLKSHDYLNTYDRMDKEKQVVIVSQTHMKEPLTEREQEVLKELLAGKSNKGIASSLFITENTVKTHVRNIFYKYDVNSRAELITTLLKNQHGS